MSSIDFSRGKVFRDSVHGLIRIEEDDEFLLELIDTPELQRLRRVRQLGVSWLTYPGAEHSRFAHSLGVLAFAQRMLVALRHRYPHGTIHDLLRSKARVVKAAALLHDIGHGPFSHVVERAFGKKKHHERRTEQLITAERSTVNKILTRSGVPPSEVKAIIGGVSDFPFLQDIVSSQLDADRMDYILRDAHNSGVRYGAFDAEWILNSLCVGLDPQAQAGSSDVRQLRLCLEDRRGLHSAEQLIMARFHMSMQVYFHRATRGWEAMLLMILNEARRLGSQLPDGTPEVVRRYLAAGGDVPDEDFLNIDDVALTFAFQVWANSSASIHDRLAQLSRGFLSRKKYLRRRDIADGSNSTERKMLLERRLENCAGPKGGTWYLDDASVEIYQFVPPTKSEGANNEIKTKSILLSNGDPTSCAVPFETTSRIFSELSGAQKQALSRVYFLPEVEQAVSKAFSEADDPMIEFKSP